MTCVLVLKSSHDTWHSFMEHICIPSHRNRRNSDVNRKVHAWTLGSSRLPFLTDSVHYFYGQIFSEHLVGEEGQVQRAEDPVSAFDDVVHVVWNWNSGPQPGKGQIAHSKVRGSRLFLWMEQKADWASVCSTGGEGRAEPEGKALCLPVSQGSTPHFSWALVNDHQDRNMNTSDWKEFPLYVGLAQPLRQG